jgi:hypothetical protein
VPPDLVYDKVIDPWMYDSSYVLPAYLQGNYPYAYTSEAEAQQYEDAVREGRVPPQQMLPKSLEYQTGGKTVSDLWKEVTKSDWSQAKKLGYTDGSYEKNLELKEKLLRSIASQPAQAANKPSLKPQPRNYARSYPKPTIPSGSNSVSDATRTAPSKQQQAYEFYKEQPFGLTDPNSRIPQAVQYNMMQAATRPDEIYETPSGIRAGTQRFLNKVTNLSSNDLVNVGPSLLTYPVQAGLNIINTVAGDTPIQSDEDVLGLGLDVASLIPAVKGVSGLRRIPKMAKPPKPTRYSGRWSPEKGIVIKRKGTKGMFKDTPDEITVVDKTAPKKDGYQPLASLSAIRAKDGRYHFDFNMKDAPQAAPKLFKLLQQEVRKVQGPNSLWGAKPFVFHETGTMSLDSYRLLMNRLRDPNFTMKPSGTTFLNAEAAKTRFLDDLADPYINSADEIEKLTPRQQNKVFNWYERGSPMEFSTKSAADQAAKRFNEKFFPGITSEDRLAKASKMNSKGKKWNLQIPNYEFMMKKHGGSTKVKIKKSR